MRANASSWLRGGQEEVMVPVGSVFFIEIIPHISLHRLGNFTANGVADNWNGARGRTWPISLHRVWPRLEMPQSDHDFHQCPKRPAIHPLWPRLWRCGCLCFLRWLICLVRRPVGINDNTLPATAGSSSTSAWNRWTQPLHHTSGQR